MEQLNLVSEIKEQIDSWISENKIRSISSLARDAGVSDSCLRRLYNNSTVPQSDNLIKILNVVSNKSSISEMKIHFSNHTSIIHFLMENFHFLEDSKLIDTARPLLGREETLKNIDCFIIFAMACNRMGLKKNELISNFGSRGAIALDLLEKANLVNLVNDLIIPIEVNFRPSKDLIKTLLPDLIRIFFKVNSEENGHFLFSETVSIDGYSKVMDVFEKFLSDISSIISDNPGGIPLLIGGFLDTMTFSPYFKSEGKKHE